MTRGVGIRYISSYNSIVYRISIFIVIPQIRTRVERVRVRVRDITFEVGGLIIGDIGKADMGVKLHSSIMPSTGYFYTD
jgi:hypothetical protein